MRSLGSESVYLRNKSTRTALGYNDFCFPADMASLPCKLSQRPTGGCGWRQWMERNLYEDILHLTIIVYSSYLTNASVFSSDLHSAFVA